MAFISFGKCKKKNIYIIISIILSYLIFQTEYYSEFYFDCKGYNSPRLFSLYFSFSFFGSLLTGLILFFLIEYNNNKSKEDENKNCDKRDNIKEHKKEIKNKKKIYIPLLYEENINQINVPIKYLILSSFLELISNFSFYSIALDFLDIETKMLFNGFEIIIIKIIGKCIYKNQLYKHQIISIVILLIILIIGILIREGYLQKIINNKIIINETIGEYIKNIAKKKITSQIYFFCFIFIFLGNIANSFSVWFDNWLMNVKLCNPHKLLFFKGLFGFIPAFTIQFILYYFIGEKNKLEKNDEINIISILKNASFPFSSFKSIINIMIIFIFFILISFYQFSITYTNNKFQPDFVGFVIIFSSGLSIISNEILNIFIFHSSAKILYIIPLSFFIISLITSLIICEIIILHFCGCDKNTASNIDIRATLESVSSFQNYIDNEIKEEEKINIDDLSNVSEEKY